MKNNRFESWRERENFIKTIEELKERAVIVEGKKDVKALKALGIENVIPLNNMPLTKFAQNIAERVSTAKAGLSVSREVVILTDFDREGRKLYVKLRLLLQSYKVRVNARLRCCMMNFGKNKIEDFSRTATLLAGGLKIGNELRRGDFHGETSADFYEIPDKGEDKRGWSNRKARCHRGRVRPD